MPDSSQIRIETCSIHGLRFNAASHSGCARCRKEAGEALTGVAKAAETRAPSGSPPPPTSGGNHAPMAGAVGLAALLILLVGTAFYWGHAQVWTEGRKMLGLTDSADSSSEQLEQLGEMAEKLGEATRDIDPETADALIEMGRQLGQQGVPMDVEGELNQDDQARIRRQIEQIEPTTERAGGDG